MYNSHEGLSGKQGLSAPCAPKEKKRSLKKILTVERGARPKYRQGARRVCKIYYTAAGNAEQEGSVTLPSVVDVSRMSQVDSVLNVQIQKKINQYRLVSSM